MSSRRKFLAFKAAIFDLDGVLTSTTEHHFQAWKEMFETEVGASNFTNLDYSKYVSGKPRLDGIRSFLESRKISVNETELIRLSDIKQALLLKLFRRKPVKIFPDAAELIKKFKAKGIKLAVASSSKNTPIILDKIGCKNFFDVVVANTKIFTKNEEYDFPLKGKPEPDIFLKSCEYLGVKPSQTIGFEDAVSGIQALKKAGIFSIGVNRDRIKKELSAAGADMVVSDLKDFNFL